MRATVIRNIQFEMDERELAIVVRGLAAIQATVPGALALLNDCAALLQAPQVGVMEQRVGDGQPALLPPLPPSAYPADAVPLPESLVPPPPPPPPPINPNDPLGALRALAHGAFTGADLVGLRQVTPRAEPPPADALEMYARQEGTQQLPPPRDAEEEAKRLATWAGR